MIWFKYWLIRNTIVHPAWSLRYWFVVMPCVDVLGLARMTSIVYGKQWSDGISNDTNMCGTKMGRYEIGRRLDWRFNLNRLRCPQNRWDRPTEESHAIGHIRWRLSDRIHIDQAFEWSNHVGTGSFRRYRGCPQFRRPPDGICKCPT